MNKKNIIAASIFAAITAFPSQANIIFEFNYVDNVSNPGVGFLDATYGAARQEAMEEAGTLYSNLFGNYFSNSGTIYLDATSSDNPASSTLASAGSYLTSGCSGTGNCVVNEIVKTKLQTGVDANGDGFGTILSDGTGSNTDGGVNVNWGAEWTVDSDDTDPNKFDFFAAIFHELTHALGFSSMISEDGSGIFNNEWSMFDTFLQNANGDSIIQSDSTLDQTVWDDAKTGGTGSGIFFGGANAVAANGGDLVGIYSPTSWADGSSGSHIDGAPFPTDMMKYDRGYGPETRTFSPIDVGVLTDIGYTRNATTSVPEPTTLGLFGMLCALFIRRRKHS